MRRPWIVVAAGVVLFGTAVLLGLILFRRFGAFELTLPELTIWSIVVGSMTVAFLGLLVVEMRAPSVTRRARSFLFGLFGGICGLVAGTVYGVFSIREVVSCDYGDCGWSVLGLTTSSFWPALGLLAVLGVVLGAVAGVTVARILRGSTAPVAATPEA